MSVPSYESILQDALNRVSEKFDKREGAIIFDALAPASFKIHEQYKDREYKLQEGFAGTCSRERLMERAKEIGMEPPYAARPSVVEATLMPANVEVPEGTRFNCDKLNFFVQNKISEGVYQLQCETAGPEGNLSSGALLPIDYIDGLQSAAITKILIFGENEQDTEEYRDLYFANVKGENRDGNIKQYELWTSEYPGIGNYKIFPLWNGACTVKISILDTNHAPASEALIKEYQDYMDPGSTGLGNGIAPIGAIITVTTAMEKMINISGRIALATGYAEPEGLDRLLADYLRGLAYVKTTVSYMAIGALILSCPAVDNLTDLLVNGDKVDIELGEEEIPVYGTGVWTT